jgi:hypothetical protein
MCRQRPANYAQRSGRAGRGGQPALVYTYCAGRSPHDQYYFREPNQMVSGSVAPPRIDIRNRDLMRSHVHAIWMEMAKPDLGKTLTTVVDLSPADGKFPLPVKASLAAELKNPVYRAAALGRANQLVASISDELATTAWFHDNWTKETLDQIERAFDSSCDRWRSLYRSAVRQRELHHKIIGDHSRPEEERNHSRRLRAQAESQIRLLTEAEGVYEGDFYSYRYFAAEGFLPGYNFPRLPLSAYVPGRRQRNIAARPAWLRVTPPAEFQLLFLPTRDEYDDRQTSSKAYSIPTTANRPVMDVLWMGKRRARKFMADALIWGCGLESCEPLRLVGRRFPLGVQPR